MKLIKILNICKRIKIIGIFKKDISTLIMSNCVVLHLKSCRWFQFKCFTYSTTVIIVHLRENLDGTFLENELNQIIAGSENLENWIESYLNKRLGFLQLASNIVNKSFFSSLVKNSCPESANLSKVVAIIDVITGNISS